MEHIELQNVYKVREIKELYNGFNVIVKLIEELPTEDEGKFQYGGNIYQIVLNNEDIEMFIMQSWCRAGSYYNDYEYYYDDAELCEKYEKVVIDWRVLKAEDECHFDY